MTDILPVLRVLGMLIMLFAMANAGLPATSGFVGEFMVILASVKFNFWVGLLAATALVLGAGYSLWMVKRVIFGAVANEEVASLADIGKREFLMLALLAIAVMAIGVYPALVTDAIVAAAGVPARRVSATLTVLTIRALVRQLPGGRFEALVRLS